MFLYILDNDIIIFVDLCKGADADFGMSVPLIFCEVKFYALDSKRAGEADIA